MKVLSLFDGMSCGQIALNRLGIKVDKYYASEIDKYAIQVTQANFPETIQIGDVCDIKAEDYQDVDLIMAGSPCQGFSFAGKQLAFDDPRSALFFEFIRLLKEIKPKYFLLENVKMKKEYLQVISEQVSACYPKIPFGIEPIFINSSLVSAQNRQRYYWTNIPNITQPEERGIVLRDILEENPAENPVKDTKRNRRHYKNPDQKSLCMTATMYKGAGNNGMTLVPQKLLDDNLPKMTTKDEKAYCLTASYSAAEPVNSMERKQRTMIPVEEGQEMPEDITLVYDNEGKSHKPEHIGTAVDVNMLVDDTSDLPQKSQTIKSQYYKSSKANFERKGTFHATGIKQKPIQAGTAVDVNGHDILKRVYSPDGKSPTVNTCQGGNREPKVLVKAMTEVRTPEANKIRYEHRKKTGKDWSPRNMRHLVERKDEKMNTLTSALTKQHIMQITKDDTQEVYWRKLTPLECERLQTVPDNYTNHVSNTQRYKMLGNGWTIEVITHILKNMEL